MDMKKKKYSIIIKVSLLVVFMLLIFTSCIPGDNPTNIVKPAGFLWGIWHGWLAPISLIISIFNKNINIYETVNVGFWYDFGYYIAIISGFGSISMVRKKNRSNSNCNS